MTRHHSHSGHRLSALIAALSALLLPADLRADAVSGAADLRQRHYQQTMDLRREQQRYRSAVRPVAPREYARVERRLLRERTRQQTLHERQALDMRLKHRPGKPASTPAHRASDRLRYKKEQDAQRLGFTMKRRPLNRIEQRYSPQYRPLRQFHR